MKELDFLNALWKMKHIKAAENIFSSRKRLFWFGHIIFWLIILLESIIINPETVNSLDNFLGVFSIVLSGFFITYLLRLLFRKLFVHRLKLFTSVQVAFIYSLIAALMWTYSFFVLYHFLKGATIKVPFYIITHLFEINFITIALWSGLYLGYKIWEEWNIQKYQLEHERALLRTSQLEMLRYQLNPHFMFNTLSSLRALIRRKDNDIAEEMVTKISEFLKYSLLEGENSKVPLSKEIKIINHYFDIEKVRFKDQLLVEYYIDPLTNNFLIPVFLIHPLIENAVKHGMKTSPSPLHILIKTEMINQDLQIDISNTGRWIDKEIDADSTGTGLQNTKKRLELAYPNNHSFEIFKENDSVHIQLKIMKD